MGADKKLPICKPARWREFGAHLPVVAQDLPLKLRLNSSLVEGRDEVALKVGLAEIPRCGWRGMQPQLVFRVRDRGEKLAYRGDSHGRAKPRPALCQAPAPPLPVPFWPMPPDRPRARSWAWNTPRPRRNTAL